MDSSAVVPSKVAVECLLRQFVSPLLPRLKISRPPPTVEEQKKVGKQMHAVVMLYNYYQRKESPLSEYLDFRSFCETACISYPSLIYYMKFMCNSTRSFEDDHDQLSITEKFVMNACDICTALNASIDSCNIHEWAISKVAVFLVDAAKENCLLKNGNIILGSWSLVEKDLEKPLEKSACSPEMSYAYKNEGTTIESDKCYVDDFLQEIAYSIVEQDMGITFSNLNILEYHFSYSLSQPKSSAILYIMSYKLPASSAVEISIEDVISLRGPPVKCSSHATTPEITSVAKHYCLLPYVDIVSEWASRKTAIASLIAPTYQVKFKESIKGAPNNGFLYSLCQTADTGEKSYYSVYKNGNFKVSARFYDTYETKHTSKKKMKLDCEINDPLKKSSQHWTDGSSSRDHNQNPCHDGSGSKCRSFISNKLICNYERTRSNGDLCLPNDSKDQMLCSVKKQCLASSDGNTLKEKHSFINQGNTVATALQIFPAHHKLNDYASRFLALAPNKNNFEAIVFEFLKNRRDDLCRQHRLLEDFIAQCEMIIQILIGGENQISHPEKIMKSCDFLLSYKVNGGTNLLGEVQLQPHDIRRKLLDADLRLRSSCKELDEISCRNHWILPKYSVFPLPNNGKFRSILTVKGLDFEYTLRGDPGDGPDQARESAAASMLAKLHEMAAQAHCR